MDVLLVFKGATHSATLDVSASTDGLFDAAERKHSLEGQKLKLIYKGKQILPNVKLADTPLANASNPKVMVMATGAKEVAGVLAAKSDPTVRSFASEDAAASHHTEQQRSEELSEWQRPQHKEFKFCRFESCTWQSFGTRPSSSTPHAFEARQLMLRLAQDPGICAIMEAREYTGTHALRTQTTFPLIEYE